MWLCTREKKKGRLEADHARPLSGALASRYVGVLKKFSSFIEGSVIEGQMDPAVVGKFKMTPVVSSMASELKKAAEANNSVSGSPRPGSPDCGTLHYAPPRLVKPFSEVFVSIVFISRLFFAVIRQYVVRPMLQSPFLVVTFPL